MLALGLRSGGARQGLTTSILTRNVNEARTLEAEARTLEAEARTLEAEARTLEAEAEVRILDAKVEAKAEFIQFWPSEL